MIVALLIICAILVVLLLNNLYMKTNAHMMVQNQVEKFANVPRNLQIINLGSSYAKYGISYDESERKGFNFALAPQSLKYDLKILKQYTNHCEKNCIVLIVIGLCEFLLDDYHHEQSNLKYYYFLDKKYIKNYRRYKRWLYLKLPVLIMPWKVKYIFKDIKPLVAMEETQSEMHVESMAIDRIDGWKKEFAGLDIDDRKKLTFEKVKKTLSEMLQYCEEYNFRPIIVIPPATKELKDALINERVDVENLLYNNISKDTIGETPILDYFKDDFIQEKEFFLNADFLSESGSKLFSNKLFSDVKKIISD